MHGTARSSNPAGDTFFQKRKFNVWFVALREFIIHPRRKMNNTGHFRGAALIFWSFRFRVRRVAQINAEQPLLSPLKDTKQLWFYGNFCLAAVVLVHCDALKRRMEL